MDRYPLKRKLKDGTSITIREMHPGDEGELLEFFKGLPLSERQYLRSDVTEIETIRRRMNPGPFKRIWRLAADCDGKIIADCTLSGAAAGWRRHVAEIRCLVHPDFKRKGLGSILLWELFQICLVEKYHIVFYDVIPEQGSAVGILKNLGFKRVMIRRNHVKDIKGQSHDLHIYVMDIKAMWDNLKDHFHRFDTTFGHV